MNSANTIPQLGNMALKTTVLDFINTVTHRLELARIMGVGEQAISKYIARNDVKLTQYGPLMYIKSEMKAEFFSDLLEPKKVAVHA